MVLKCAPQQPSPIVLHLLEPRLCKRDTSWLLEPSSVANDHSMRHAKSHGGKMAAFVPDVYQSVVEVEQHHVPAKRDLPCQSR